MVPRYNNRINQQIKNDKTRVLLANVQGIFKKKLSLLECSFDVVNKYIHTRGAAALQQWTQTYEICKKAYNNLNDHRCDNNCSLCNRGNDKCVKEKIIKKCDFCFKVCNNETCYKLHIANNCHKKLFCEICNKIKTRNHVCRNQKYCTSCKKVKLIYY